MGGAPCSICGDAAHTLLQGEPICSVCLARAVPGIDVAGMLDAALSGTTPAGTCPACGTALKEFRKSGLLGCAFCYVAFRPEVE